MNRRRFFSFLGAAPVVGVGAIAAHANKQYQPSDNDLGLLILNSSEKSVKFVVGKDGNMWIHQNSKWGKLSVE